MKKEETWEILIFIVKKRKQNSTDEKNFHVEISEARRRRGQPKNENGGRKERERSIFWRKKQIAGSGRRDRV